jgi:hypothetical protein
VLGASDPLLFDHAACVVASPIGALRVVSDGAVRAGGLELKARLLALEGITLV